MFVPGSSRWGRRQQFGSKTKWGVTAQVLGSGELLDATWFARMNLAVERAGDSG
jgi:hypothetical protein